MVNKPRALNSESPTPLLNDQGELTAAFSNVIDDIFRKFDLFIGRELSYQEFKILYRMINSTQDLSQEDFSEKFLKKYCCTNEGMTLRGLRDYFTDSVKTLGEDVVRAWL